MGFSLSCGHWQGMGGGASDVLLGLAAWFGLIG